MILFNDTFSSVWLQLISKNFFVFKFFKTNFVIMYVICLYGLIRTVCHICLYGLARNAN